MTVNGDFYGSNNNFKFNELGHELKSGQRTAGRPYFIVTQNSLVWESYFRTMEKLNRIVIAMSNNPIRIKGNIIVFINGNHLLYFGPLKTLEAKKTEALKV